MLLAHQAHEFTQFAHSMSQTKYSQIECRLLKFVNSQIVCRIIEQFMVWEYDLIFERILKLKIPFYKDFL
jgi:hypothetical protein